MLSLTKQKELLDVVTPALGLGLALVYLFGLLITNVYLSRFGISDFSMLRVRYLTTGFAFLGFSLLPLIVLLTPVCAFYYLCARKFLLALAASSLALLVVAGTGYLVLWFVVKDAVRTAPWTLYAASLPGGLVGGRWLGALLTWFTPAVLLVGVYLPLVSMVLAWRLGRARKAVLVIGIPLLLFGAGSTLTRFAGAHYAKLRPAFGGPTATVSDVVLGATACAPLGVELVSAGEDGFCVLEDVTVLHETGQRLYVRQPGHEGRVLQIPLADVKLIAEAQD